MTKCIDIEIVIDTVSLLKAFPNPSKTSTNPTMIDHTSYSYMIAQTAYVNGGQASGNLSIKALVNDTIRWRCLSLSGNTDQSAVVYDIQWFKDDKVTNTPEANLSQPYSPLPTIVDGRNTNPPTFTAAIENDYFMQATVNKHGKEQYKVYFYVTDSDPNTGKPVLKGYFGWDPEITVA